MKNGGIVASAIGKDIDYVVVGTDPGSKYEKAKKLGLTIIDEDQFKKLVGVS
jgi:DNA ligase (NAD+)